MRKLTHAVLGLSIAYSAFVWYWAIVALQWHGNENWGAVYAGVLGMLGGIVQFTVAAIITGVTHWKKSQVYTRLPRTWGIVAIQAGWVLSAIAVVAAFCA